MKRIPALALLVLLSMRPGAARAWFVGDAVQIKILQENIQQTINLSQQLSQLGSVLRTTRDNLEFARSTYALAQDVIHFNPDQFLREAQAYFYAHNPELAAARDLAGDISRNGVRATYFNAGPLNQQVAIFMEDKEAKACGCDCHGQPAQGQPDSCMPTCSAAHARGYPFAGCEKTTEAADASSNVIDKEAARRLSAAAALSIEDPDVREKLLQRPSSPDASDGLMLASLARTDPAAADALLRQRALAASARKEARALHQRLQQGNVNVGDAALLAARTSSLAAEQLSAIREDQAKQIAMEQQRHAAEEEARAREARDMRLHALHFSDMVFMSLSSRSGVPPEPRWEP
jgi:hypothetical protein